MYARNKFKLNSSMIRRQCGPYKLQRSGKRDLIPSFELLKYIERVRFPSRHLLLVLLWLKFYHFLTTAHTTDFVLGDIRNFQHKLILKQFDEIKLPTTHQKLDFFRINLFVIHLFELRLGNDIKTLPPRHLQRHWLQASLTLEQHLGLQLQRQTGTLSYPRLTPDLKPDDPEFIVTDGICVSNHGLGRQILYRALEQSHRKSTTKLAPVFDKIPQIESLQHSPVVLATQAPVARTVPINSHQNHPPSKTTSQTSPRQQVSGSTLVKFLRRRTAVNNQGTAAIPRLLRYY